MLDFGRTKELVGLDIGSYSIKAVELKSKKKEGKEFYELAHLGYEILPHDAIVEGTIIDTTAVAEIIKIIFEENNISNKNVVISISGNSVIIKKLSLPMMDSDELAESIIWEAKHNIPYAFEEINIDYTVLPHPQKSEGKDLDILLVAAKKDKIENYSNVIHQAQKNLKAIEVDVFTLQNALEINYPEIFNEKTIAIINIGATVTNIIVIERGNPQLFRDLSMGGIFFTENIRNELNISFDVAEKLLKGILVESVDTEKIEKALSMNTKELLDEIDKTFSFYEVGEKNDKKIDLILLSGGLAKLKGLDKHFEQRLKIETKIFNTFRNIQINEKKFPLAKIQDMTPFFGVALGLASGKIEK
ncbi:MAG: type IV pilus assembly protein PilM [Candidatus Aminicenantaceae bacterium]